MRVTPRKRDRCASDWCGPLFHTTFASQVDYGVFVDHLIMIAGLLYIAAYGAALQQLFAGQP